MDDWSKFEREMATVVPKSELDAVDALSELYSERIRRGISQRELAAKIGMKQPQLAKIERLDSVPTYATLQRYAAGLGLKIKMVISE
jgi:transcriptional regulator with XRE-family HTH domain